MSIHATRIAGIVLAAGASKRLGHAKQQVALDEASTETLLQRAVRVALEAELSPLIVVLRAGATFADNLPHCTLVTNPEAEEGIAASIRHGIRALPAVTGVVLLTCDQVNLRPGHLRALCAHPDRITASLYAKRNGVPAFFPASTFEQLLTLSGDSGARDLLRSADFITDESLALDIDTPDDLARARAALKALASQRP